MTPKQTNNFDDLRKYVEYDPASGLFNMYLQSYIPNTLFYVCSLDGKQSILHLDAEIIPSPNDRDDIFSAFLMIHSMNLNEAVTHLCKKNLDLEQQTRRLPNRTDENYFAILQGKATLIKAGMETITRVPPEQIKFSDDHEFMDLFANFIKLKDAERAEVIKKWQNMPGAEKYMQGLTASEATIASSTTNFSTHEVERTMQHALELIGPRDTLRTIQYASNYDGTYRFLCYQVDASGVQNIAYHQALPSDFVEAISHVLNKQDTRTAEEIYERLYKERLTINGIKFNPNSRVYGSDLQNKSMQAMIKDRAALLDSIVQEMDTVQMSRIEIHACVAAMAARANQPKMRTLIDFHSFPENLRNHMVQIWIKDKKTKLTKNQTRKWEGTTTSTLDLTTVQRMQLRMNFVERGSHRRR